MSKAEKFFRVVSGAELSYDGCYYESDSPDINHKLDVTSFDHVEDLMRAVLKDHAHIMEELLNEMGYVKKTKIDRTQKLSLEAKYVVMRRNTLHTYSDRFKMVDLDDPNLAHVFSCYDTKEVFELYQKVKMSTLKKVHPEAYKAYQDMKKEVADANKKRKVAAIKSKATRKRKEIEKAKKLLEEAGEEA